MAKPQIKLKAAHIVDQIGQYMYLSTGSVKYCSIQRSADPWWCSLSMLMVPTTRNLACLVPSHYLNQYWLIVNWTLGNKSH